MQPKMIKYLTLSFEPEKKGKHIGFFNISLPPSLLLFPSPSSNDFRWPPYRATRCEKLSASLIVWVLAAPSPARESSRSGGHQKSA